MLKKVLLGVAGLVAVLLVVVAVQPSSYHVERSTTISAPAQMVWAEVSDFNQWKDWSHWAKSDPQQKTTITGEPGTVGHASSWDGEKTGKGTMTIYEAKAPTHMGIKLAFTTPMASEAVNALQLVPKDEAVEVTWSMDGENGFVGKFFGLFMGMEGMIGSAYEASLANLKTIVEEKAKKQAEAMAAAAPAAEGGEAEQEGAAVEAK